MANLTTNFHMCNATQSRAWAYISVAYFSDNCTLVRYGYDDPFKVPKYIFYIYIISYYIISVVCLPLFMLVLYRGIKRIFQPYIHPERQALIAVPPDGYWGDQVADNAPFGNFFRNLIQRG